MPYDKDSSSSISVLSTRTEVSGLQHLAKPGLWLLLYHRDGSQMVPLHEGQQVVIGRARPADVAIRDGSLSRQHARIELVEGVIWVEDLESTNGTLLNGKKIKRSRVKLTDELRLGAVTAAFHTVSSSEGVMLGLESYDRLLDKLEAEVLRAQTFSRPLALLMVRSVERHHGHLSRWAPRVRQLLRPVDAIALHDALSVVILLVESGRAEALALAEAVVKGKAKGEPVLACGLASLPENAASADQLVEAARHAAHQATPSRPVIAAGGEAGTRHEPSDERPVLVSAAIREVHETAKRIADAIVPVLIYGETGTGKEVLARAIHQSSRRRSKPLRCLNCAAIPAQLVESALFGHERGAFTGADQRARGVFEEAEGGSVLLDEIGELSPSAQGALLRVIETRRLSRVGSSKDFEVDVRVMAATHRDLEQMCEAGQFRWDLFYRLNSIMLRLPPLRERPEDIQPLAESFMRAACKANRCKVQKIEPEALKLLQAHRWPGNVRELRNTIERAVLIAQDEVITSEDLPEKIRRERPATAARPVEEDDGLSIKDKLRRYESQLLLEALQANAWNQTRTAAALSMPLRTLVHKMQLLGLRKKYDTD